MLHSSVSPFRNRIIKAHLVQMARFDLVPLDGSSPIHLPDGETLLGRGPFLRVTDKRVSRHHGLLESHDGKLHIKSTHVNPCFRQTSLDDPPCALERDQWHRLGHGDIFSLLPGQFLYKVMAVAGEDVTLRNSQVLQDEDEAVVRTPPHPEPGDKHGPTAGQDFTRTIPAEEPEESKLQDGLDQKKLTDELSTTTTPKQAKAVLAQAEKDKNKLKVEPKKRVLPAWMMVSVADLTTTSTSKEAGNRERSMASPKTSTNRHTAKPARKTVASSGEESEPREAANQDTAKRARKTVPSSGEEPEPREAANLDTAKRTRKTVASSGEESEPCEAANRHTAKRARKTVASSGEESEPCEAANRHTAKRARKTVPSSGEESELREAASQDTAKRARASSLGEESEPSEAEAMPSKRMRPKNSQEDVEVVRSKTLLNARQQVKPSNSEECDESDDFLMKVEEDEEHRRGEDICAASGSCPSTSRVEPSGPENKERFLKNGQKVSKVEAQPSDPISGPVQSKHQHRTPCQYGGNCYRKNPVHFQECSHPGDSDYVDESEKEDEDDEADSVDRPECPYGTDCYRKNPLHRKEYRHTKKTRAKKPVSYYNDDDDDFGDDDSFINDGSEDNEDSEYEPPDSEESGKEDIERLKKEAKDFTRMK
ncbi:hypothetical protein DPEC_G00177120 [Dallia pectoralis]|uniref:Uncharacterized protein n=1 Tax=Dallia pectoralis TaxID=75939 RepID=A0ACC2GF14_DALPE|nr:hypothetical protein DPEC_G00177120 [Dallia pectoralis]